MRLRGLRTIDGAREVKTTVPQGRLRVPFVGLAFPSAGPETLNLLFRSAGAWSGERSSTTMRSSSVTMHIREALKPSIAKL